MLLVALTNEAKVALAIIVPAAEELKRAASPNVVLALDVANTTSALHEGGLAVSPVVEKADIASRVTSFPRAESPVTGATVPDPIPM